MKKLILFFLLFSSFAFSQNKITAGFLVSTNFPGTLEYFIRDVGEGNTKISSGDNGKVKANLALNFLYEVNKNVSLGAEFEVNDVNSNSNYAIEFITHYLFPLTKMSPYIHGGVGLNINSAKLTSSGGANNGLIYNLGGGLLIPIAKNISLDFRIVYKKLDFNYSETYNLQVGTEGPVFYKGTYQTINTSLGLAFNL